MSSFAYNGRGDRTRQTVDGVMTEYVLDMEAGLTQVLDDGAHVYLYRVGRLAQDSAAGKEYFLADVLGSVRLLVDESGQPVMDRAYKPYGEALDSSGSGSSAYGFTGEAEDAATGLTYLRARYYSAAQGRFTSRDTWSGILGQPLSFNRWNYSLANPINLVDPSGMAPWQICDVILPGDCYTYMIFEQSYGMRFAEGEFKWVDNQMEAQAVARAVRKVGQVLSRFSGLSQERTFQEVFGGINFVLEDLRSETNKKSGDTRGPFGWTSGPHKIKIHPGKVVHDPCNYHLVDFETDPLARLVVHEIGHAFSSRLDEQYQKLRSVIPMSPDKYLNSPENLLLDEGIYDFFDSEHGFVTGYDKSLGKYNRNGIGATITNKTKYPQDYPYLGPTYSEYRVVNGVKYYVYTGYQWHSEALRDEDSNSAGEDWADIFMNWTYGSFNFKSSKGLTLFFWTQMHMQEWVNMAMSRVGTR